MSEVADDIYRTIERVAEKKAAEVQQKTKLGIVRSVGADGTMGVLIDGNTYPTADGEESKVTECKSLVSAAYGDRVAVSIAANGEAIIIGNHTKPSINDNEYDYVKQRANDADTTLSNLRTYVAQAQQDVDETQGQVKKSLEEVVAAAATASSDLAQIQKDVAAANTLKQEIDAAKTSAGKSLEEIFTDATTSKAEATKATKAANSAEAGLARVQDVVGVVNWLESHAIESADTEVVADKKYYTRNPATGALTLVENPVIPHEGDPYWEISDETVSEYINSYLALVDGELRLSSGGASSAMVRLSKDALRFIAADGGEVATIEVNGRTNRSEMRVTRNVVLDDMRLGDWQWCKRVNGNLSLVFAR